MFFGAVFYLYKNVEIDMILLFYSEFGLTAYLEPSSEPIASGRISFCCGATTFFNDFSAESSFSKFFRADFECALALGGRLNIFMMN